MALSTIDAKQMNIYIDNNNEINIDVVNHFDFKKQIKHTNKLFITIEKKVEH